MILEVHSASFSYQKEAPLLKNISFQLDQGEIMAVMGKNGSGKTTLIKCLVGILKWQKGYSTIKGQPVSSCEPSKDIGYVPQAHKVPFAYTVRDMVVFARIGRKIFSGAPQKEDYHQADAALEKVGIGNLRNKYCNELSGGQLQLVFIARALVNSPSLLILDEPEAHLDFRNQLKLLTLIEHIVAEKRIGCILNTHYPNNALRIAHSCFLMGDQKYIHGKAKTIMTEENIKIYFGVSSQIFEHQHHGKLINTFAFLDIT